jgi:hypothetical protein
MNYCFTATGLFHLKLTYGRLVTESPFVRTAPEDQSATRNPTSIPSHLLVGFDLNCFNIQPQGNLDPTFTLCFCMKTPHSKVRA